MVDIFAKLKIRTATTKYIYSVRPVFNSVVKKKYDQVIADARSECNMMQEVKLLGDGQFSKVGWSARFCTYYMVEAHTHKILDQLVFTREMAKSSSDMEQMAASKSFDTLDNDPNIKHKIKVFTTDQSTSVKGMLKRKNEVRKKKGLPEAKHNADVWHSVKLVDKDARKLEKTKAGRKLKPWMPGVKRIMYSASQKSKGRPVYVQEKVLSILGHMCDIHQFAGNYCLQAL